MPIAMQSSMSNKISTYEELDIAAKSVHQNKEAWLNTPLDERIRILDEIIAAIDSIADNWVQSSWDAKGIAAEDNAAAEDWALIAIVFRLLHALKSSLEEIATQGRPQIQSIYTRPDGRVVAEIFPKFTKDKLLYATLTGEVWFNEGVLQEDVLNHMALHYQQAQDGIVTLVLGAGNASALVAGDFLYKLFVENHVVILKMNPVNDYLGQWITLGFAPLIERGVLQVVYGDVDEGQYLIHHDLVDELHMTGSASTYEAIVYGTGEEAHNPKINKRFTAELGNISPVIIVPGAWTEQEVITQAKNLASRLISNAGFNCLTPRLIIQHEQWQHRDLFNSTINQTLAQLPTRKAYYPDAEQRHSAFIDAYPHAIQHGDNTQGHLAWTYISDIDAQDKQTIAFSAEAFCSVYTETALSADSITDFIAQATDLVNEHVWGTLVATILVHPDSMKDSHVAAAVEQAIADLRYGTVAINAYGETAYLTAMTPWGAYAGQHSADIQSGFGFVNNTLMFDASQIQKSIIRQGFNAPTNAIDPVNKPMNAVLEPIARFEAKSTLKRGLKLIRAILSG